MQRAQVCAALGTVVMLAASSTYAGQVDLSIENRLGGDSNVFRSVAERKNAGTFDIAPRLALHDDDEDVTYGLDYAPIYRNFIKTSGIDGVDHRASARVGWMVSPVDKLELSGSYYNGRQYLFGPTGSGSGSTVTVNDRERLRISEANLGYRHSLTRRLSMRMDGFFTDFDASGTSPNSQSDSRAYTGRLSTQYALTPRASIGLSTSVRRRENRAVDGLSVNGNRIPRPQTRTDVYDVLALVSYEFTPTLSASVQVGPSLIRQQQIPGGTTFPKDESRNANVFATASVEKTWQTGELILSYLRSEARSGNVASSSSINDDVQINWNQHISERLGNRVSVGWDRFKQISTGGINSSRYETNALRATETIEFTLTRRVMLIGQYSYTWQKTSNAIAGGTGSSSGSVDVNAHVGYVGIRYSFEPLSY